MNDFATILALRPESTDGAAAMSKTVVITGANRGIGLQLARKYAARLDRVFAVCRSLNPELDKVEGVTVVSDIDVGRDEDVQRLSSSLKGETIDVLINNAGILRVDGLDQLDFQDMAAQFAINAMAPLRVTSNLLPLMAKPGGKVAIITSRMGSIDDGSGGMYGYRMSKAAVNMAGSSLAHDLKGLGISVCLLHPGYVKTDMTNHNGTVLPADSARGLIDRIEGMSLENTGTFWHMNGEVLPW